MSSAPLKNWFQKAKEAAEYLYEKHKGERKTPEKVSAMLCEAYLLGVHDKSDSLHDELDQDVEENWDGLKGKS